MQAARFAVMGTQAHVVVVDGDPEALEVAETHLRGLESRWSRFLPDSELCRINRAAGRPVLVSPPTMLAVTLAVQGWRRTAGRFDPTVLPALEAAGYDRPFVEVARRAAGPVRRSPGAPGAGTIELDPIVGAVTLPPGTRIDLGGLGKGLAADLTAALLVDRGVGGAIVNVGGDLRAVGSGPTPEGWTIALHRGGSFTIADGGVATSAVTARRWSRAGVEHHHVIDPATGHSARNSVRWVTAVAATAVDAEITATAAMVSGTAAIELLEEHGVAGVVAHAGGRVDTTDVFAIHREPA